MTALAPDLAEFAPAAVLAERRERDLRLFRRFHRLAGPVVLFAGPYERGGGLEEAVRAALRLSAELPDLRLVALPFGRVDRRYLDRCEREALALGHRGIVEWRVEERELPLWFAVAEVVCLPGREPDELALRLAAAAEAPVVTGAATDAELDAALRARLPEPRPAEPAAGADGCGC